MKKILLALTLAVFLLLSGCTGEAQAQTEPFTVPDLTVSGKLILTAKADDTLELLWNGVSGADGYRVELLGPNGQVLATTDTDTNHCTVPAISGSCTISITCFVKSGEEVLLCDSAFSVTDTFICPEVTPALVRINPVNAATVLDFLLPDGCCARLFRESGELLQILDTGHAELPLEADGVYYLDCYYDGGSYLYYGLPTEPFSLNAAEVIPGSTELDISLEDLPGNYIRFSWPQEEGFLYRLEQKDGDAWKTLYEGTDGAYTPTRLTPHREYRFRLVILWNGREVLTTAEIPVTRGSNVLFATVWPIQELNVYSDTNQSKTLGTVDPVTPLCVLEEDGKWFKVRFQEGYGYILSDLCMVNLPEFLGDLCLYDIVNSYESLYHVHGYPMPEVTGQVCVGYEHVKQHDGSFLVPYLYPSANRLERAATEAISKGYILKIYDSYRPRETTIDLYDRAGDLLYTNLPDGSRTYLSLMTKDGAYALNYFLAPGGSRHNMGIAVDLTMVNLSTGQELQTQSTMHDLSWYSVLDSNTDDAKRLSKIMKGVGFSDLFSEWWHFSDAEMLEDYDLPYCYGGVSAACWVYDGTGWRYRTENGTFLVSTTETVEGKTCTFDENGYVTE